MNATSDDRNEEILRCLHRILELLEADPPRVTMTLDGKVVRESLLKIRRSSGKGLGLA